MTFAPDSIRAVRSLLKGEDADLDDTELGIVGGPSHVRTGTSYHLGKDQLIMSKNPYSVRTARDKAGLSNASSALDIDDDLDELRELSIWLVKECRANAPDTRDIREIIYSPDGVQVLQWDRERGITSQSQPHSDLSHRMHTHISWYRDSEFRDKTAVFRRFYEEKSMATATENQVYNLYLAAFSGGSSCGRKTPAGSNSQVAKLDHMWGLLDGVTTKVDALAQLAGKPLSDEQLVTLADLIAARQADAIRAIVREEIDKTKLGGA